MDIVIYRRNNCYLLIQIYVLLYLLYFYPYLFSGSQLSEHTFYGKFFLYQKVCLCFFYFYFGFFIVFPASKKLEGEYPLYNLNTLQVCIIYLLIIFLLYKTFKIGSNIFSGGSLGGAYSAYMKNLKESSVIPLLFVVVLTIYAYSNNSKKIVVYLLALCYMFFCLTRGFRITMLPVVLLVFLRYYNNKLKPAFFFLFVAIGFCAMIMMNAMKNNESFAVIPHDEIIISHHADELYGSAASFGLIQDGFIDFFDRVKLNIGLLLQSIILPSKFPDKMRLPQVVTSQTTTGGGGLIVSSLYILFGFLGNVFFPYVLVSFINVAEKSKNVFLKLFEYCIFVFCLNWISYDFHVILRMPMMACLIVWMLRNLKGRYFKIHE